MYENKTVDNLQQTALDSVSNDYDKSVGSFIYDALKPFSIESSALYSELNKTVNMLDVRNLSGDDLALFIYQRTGIVRKPSTKATGVITATGNGTITAGALFETESGVQFNATETVVIVSSGQVAIEAVNTGDSGNIPANQITLMPVTISGINIATNENPTSGGYNAESDADLIVRYYERIQTPATSGNVYHYRNWAKEIIGVGDARVFPVWNGQNTVKVIILDSNKQPADGALIEEVQSYIDPNSEGKGLGQAPIGAICTVQSASGVAINVSCILTLVNGYILTDVKASIEANLTDYLKSIAFVSSFVSFAKIGALILDTEGVVDYSALTVNSWTGNITISDTEVPVKGVVSVV